MAFRLRMGSQHALEVFLRLTPWLGSLALEKFDPENIEKGSFPLRVGLVPV